MDEKKKEIENKIIDLKGTIEAFVAETPEELSQRDEIKAYDEATDSIVYKKLKKTSNEDGTDDGDWEDDAHLKRVKKQLLDSLDKVEALAKKIFSEKESIKAVKTKQQRGRKKVQKIEQEQMQTKIKEDEERSRE